MAVDSPTPSPSPRHNSFKDCRRRDDTLAKQQQEILAKLRAIEAQQKESLELLAIFRATKGFVATVKCLGKIVMGVAAVGAAVGAIGYTIKIWAKGGGG